jgi:hypothetical protein
MCHEASGGAMTAAIGSSKGTVDPLDWEQADAIWPMGDNAATNAPRMLTWLAEADRRAAQLVHINPLIEAALWRTIVPHEFADMALPQYHYRRDEHAGADRREHGPDARGGQSRVRGSGGRSGRAGRGVPCPALDGHREQRGTVYRLAGRGVTQHGTKVQIPDAVAARPRNRVRPPSPSVTMSAQLPSWEKKV